MKLDIVLITYNQAQYIAQALDGVMMQRVNPDVDVRVIVADDASSDDTLAVIRSYEQQSPFPFVYLPAEANMGHIQNYKRAFAACDGDFVCVLEGDDWWCNPYHLQKHIDFLSIHKECVLSVNRLVEYYPDINLYSIPTDKFGHLCYYDIRDQVVKNHINNHSSACYRTSMLKKVPSYIYEAGFDDWVLGIYLSKYGLIAQLPDLTSIYRVHQEGVYSGTSTKQKLKSRRESINLVYKFIDQNFYNLLNLVEQEFDEKKIKRKRCLSYIPTFIVKLYKLLTPPVLH